MPLAAKLRKTNWLNELRILVIAGITLVLVFTAYEIVFATTGGGPTVSLPRNPTGPEKFEVGGQAMSHVATELYILEPTGAQLGWYLAGRLANVIVLIAVLSMLLGLLNRARRANPFTRATVRDLRWISVVLIAGGTLASLVEAIAAMGLSASIPPGNIAGTWKLPVLWLLTGFGALAVSEIVARGCALREELDEVV